MTLTLIRILISITCLGFGAFSTYKNYLITVANMEFSAALPFVIAGLAILFPYFSRTVKANIDVKVKNMGSGHILLLYILILTAGATTGSFLGSIIRTTPVPSQGYEIFKDVLTTTLAVIAVLIALTGALVYTIMKNRLEQVAHSEIEEQGNYLFSNILNTMSYFHYTRYQSTQKTEDLDYAIYAAEDAYDRYKRFFDEEDLESLKLICTIRNNLASYLVERGQAEDKEYALQCAEFLKNHLLKFLDRKTIWQETISSVRKKYNTK